MKTRLKRNGRIEERRNGLKSLTFFYKQTNSSICTVVRVCTYRELRI